MMTAFVRMVGKVGASLRRLLQATIILICATEPVSSAYSANYEPSTVVPPKPLREFRGVWVATVGNVDWPSKPGLSSAEQKAELVGLLDRAAQLHLNAIIFQVRPACDALYASRLEPWSEYLTGTMGKAPEPFYDPLAFAVEQAHLRGLELHAWFNPYRARHAAAKGPTSANHVSRAHLDWVRSYGKYLWLDPGEKAVQDYSVEVVMDVVRRYDLDGVHFDDYFYPYTEPDASGHDLDFPDQSSWKRYGAGGKLSREDWRRENINVFIHRVYQEIKALKPWVKFGISPFGIWRPGNPAQIKGYDAYAKLYADSRLWLANGWVDYLAPQLYWPIAQKEQSFPVLLKWWAQQNARGRHLWAGLDVSKVGGRWKSEEIANQIGLTRNQAGVGGYILYHASALTHNAVLSGELQGRIQSQPALVPASPWLESAPPPKPTLVVTNGAGSAVEVRWSVLGGQNVGAWLLQTRSNQIWQTEIVPAGTTSRRLGGATPEIVAVTMLDRAGVASSPAVVARKDPPTAPRRSNPHRT
jgi:uncharacterized lipoprotein YddW (UPF0748 family)